MTSPYGRYLENEQSYAMLTQVMRITAALEVVSNVLFYFGQLRPGGSNWISIPRDGSRGTLRHMERLLSPRSTKESVDLLSGTAISSTETLERGWA